VVHVSFEPDPQDPFPAILPMIAALGSYEYPAAGLDEPLDIYLHGYVSARIMRLAKEQQGADGGGRGLPVCVAATKVDSLVLSLTPFSHSYNYRSALLHGYATLVTSPDEKLWALQLVTDDVLPGRYEHTRTPPDKGELDTTSIMRVRVAAASAKIRTGDPMDDKKDMERDDVRDRVWVGTIPVHERFGEPVPASHNRVDAVPDYILKYIKEDA
jgi:hypothetical protein